MGVHNVSFRKNAYAANICVLGATVFSATFFFIIMLLVYEADSHEIPYVLPLAIGNLALVIMLVCYYLDFGSKLLVSEQGITLLSRLTGTKQLGWDDCRFIGIYGYNFGTGGILMFSPTQYSCLSQRDCMKHAKKKGNLLIGYTPELFKAIEQVAPPHLVSKVKILMHTGNS